MGCGGDCACACGDTTEKEETMACCSGAPGEQVVITNGKCPCGKEWKDCCNNPEHEKEDSK